MAAQQMSVTMTGFAASHPSRNSTKPELVSFRMASTPSWNTNGTWQDGPTLFINVQCWGRLAENVLGSVIKGAPLVVTGRMTCYRYVPEAPRENGKGEPVTEELWRIRATNVGLDLSHSPATWKKPAKPPVEPADADKQMVGAGVVGESMSANGRSFGGFGSGPDPDGDNQDDGDLVAPDSVGFGDGGDDIQTPY